MGTVEHPPYARVLADLEARLTGNPEVDIPLVLKEARTQATQPFGKAYSKALFQLLRRRGLITDEDQRQFDEALQSDLQRLERLRAEGWSHLKAGRVEQAQDAADRLLNIVSHLRVGDDGTRFVECDEEIESHFIRRTWTSSATPVITSPLWTPALVLRAEVSRQSGIPAQFSWRSPALPDGGKHLSQ